jgi:imidazoleglycerol-phosphate dehydratase/histidinol-phosphatase
MKTLFVDRDGTLIEEPADEQVDSLEKIRWMPGVFAALRSLQDAGFALVMVTNQDGIGGAHFPQASFDGPHNFVMHTLSSQGIHFDAVFVCPHLKSEGCLCRKPLTGLVDGFVQERRVDLGQSVMVGDRDTDLVFAQNLGIRGLRVRRHGAAHETWQAIATELLARRANVQRATKETRIDVAVNLDATAPISVSTGIGFFDHMLEQLAKHGGFALTLRCQGDLQIDEHHTVEDCALALGAALRQALGKKLGIARYGFLLPMDEALAQVALDLSGRAHAEFKGDFARETVGGLPTELVPHFFRSLAESLGAALHVSVTGANAHHMIEACFKAVGRALRDACQRRGADLPSTKGVL